MGITEADATRSDRMGRTASIISWGLTILASSYFLLIGASLYRSTSVFVKMYNSMGVELPYPTLFLTTTYRWLYPVLVAGAVIVVIAKQFRVRGVWVSVALTLAVTVAMDLISGAIVQALYSPLFELIEKLSK